MNERRDQKPRSGSPEEVPVPERFEDHPTPEELSAYQADELTPEQADAIQEHLVGCEMCTEVLLDLGRFLEPPAEDLPRDGVADLQTEAEWQTLRARLDNQGLLPLRGARKPRRNWMAAVAAIFLAAIGLAFFLALQSPGETLTLDQDQSVRSGPEPVPAFQLPKTLLLPTSPNDSYREYRVELKSGEQILRTYHHRTWSPDTFAVKIPLRRWSLKPGHYKFELQGESERNPGEPRTYPFQVR